jgi:hypothetical protein
MSELFSHGGTSEAGQLSHEQTGRNARHVVQHDVQTVVQTGVQFHDRRPGKHHTRI